MERAKEVGQVPRAGQGERMLACVEARLVAGDFKAQGPLGEKVKEHKYRRLQNGGSDSFFKMCVCVNFKYMYTCIYVCVLQESGGKRAD